jgi:hypothetical protein
MMYYKYVILRTGSPQAKGVKMSGNPPNPET